MNSFFLPTIEFSTITEKRVSLSPPMKILLFSNRFLKQTFANFNTNFSFRVISHWFFRFHTAQGKGRDVENRWRRRRKFSCSPNEKKKENIKGKIFFFSLCSMWGKSGKKEKWFFHLGESCWRHDSIVTTRPTRGRKYFYPVLSDFFSTRRRRHRHGDNAKGKLVRLGERSAGVAWWVRNGFVLEKGR